MSENKQDLSSFMSVLIMTIGCLTILLVANTLIIASNPDNLEITSVFTADSSDPEGTDVAAPLFENTRKEPAYIDVHRDYLVIYPGEERVLVGELEQRSSPFEKLLARIEKNKDREYIILLLRPKSALLGRRLRSLIADRGVDIGVELYEARKKVNYMASSRAPVDMGEEVKAAAAAPDEAEPPAGDEPGPEAAPTAGSEAPTAEGPES